MADDKPPIEEDVRHDDIEYNPALKPKSALAWLNLLTESEKAFKDYNDHCDKIDERYASLARLSQDVRDKEFQMFWANSEVIKPSIYAKPPVPVVVPKFKDRRPVYQAASEVAERCAIVSFDLAGIDELMKLVRDDVALIDRGVAWCRYESGKNGYYNHEKVCIDFKSRRDFLHSISRNWREVTWVAAASYLTRGEARKRFYQFSGDEYQQAEYRVDREGKVVGGADARERAKFWEVWDRNGKRVCWVAHGCENILDEDDPHLELRNFYPCPKPAYGTVQRGSLVPVPDVLQYRDQLEEIDMLTGRIHALSDALAVKGFYPAGGAEIADAVQTAIAIKTPGQVLVPISNWAAFGGSKEVIIWLPIDMIVSTITALVTLRKQVIEDIYQITGLADIMRGETDPQETLGAQQLKTQYGSTRIRDKQQELVRLARDLVEITIEIITEKFDKVTIIEMSQTQLPTDAMKKQALVQLSTNLMQLQQQAQQAMQNPQLQQQAQAQPDQAGQLAQQAQAAITQGQADIQKVQEKPTIEQVFKLLQDNRAKSFILDIETDSTILVDENAEKQARTEFVSALGALLPQLSQMITAEPKTAEFCGKLLKFATAPFRAGRELDGAIDELVTQMEQKSQQQRGDDPTTAQGKILLQVEQMKDATAKEKIKAESDLKQQELQQKDQHKQLELQNQRDIKQMELQSKQGDNAGKVAVQSQKAQESREAHQVELIAKDQDMALQRQKAQADMQAHQARQQDMISRSNERQRQAAQQFKLRGGLMP
jgi:hypothetical protein